MSSAGRYKYAFLGIAIGIGLGLGGGTVIDLDALHPDKVELEAALETIKNRGDILTIEISDLRKNVRLKEIEVSRLEGEISEMRADIGIPLVESEAEVDRLQAEIASLDLERKSIEAQISPLSFQLEELRQPSFEGWFQTNRIQQFLGPDYHEITGTLVNYGTARGSNVDINFRWFNGAQLVSSSTLSIESVPGRSVVRIDTSHVFDETADRFTWDITFG